MKKLAIYLAIAVVIACPFATGATDTAGVPANPDATSKTAAGSKPAVPAKTPVTKDTTVSKKAAVPTQSTTVSAATTDKSTGIDTNGAKEEHKKFPHRHKKKRHDDETAVGDGSSLNSIGARKKVDSGFDFDNSKTYHQMGN